MLVLGSWGEALTRPKRLFRSSLEQRRGFGSHLLIDRQEFKLEMTSSMDARGDLIPTSSVMMASSKHISSKCLQENVEFLKCKKKDSNPEKCLHQGREVTRCVLGLKSCLQCNRQESNTQRDGVKECHHSAPMINVTPGLKWLKTLHQACTKEMDGYARCMYYHTNEFPLCREEQQAFEKACPLQ